MSHVGWLWCCLQDKCHQYWPSERSARYQYFVVDPMAEYNMPQYILREFKVTDARVTMPVACLGFCDGALAPKREVRGTRDAIGDAVWREMSP